MSKATYNIHHDLQIHAPLSKVYEAVTEPSHLVNWWPQKCAGTPAVGQQYNFYFTEEYDWYAQVTHASPPKSFHLKMTKSDEDWDPTSFGFDLEQNKEETLVKFSHVDWPACNAHFRRSSFCWAILLKGLKDYVEEGTVVPFDKRE
ncbi:MAG: SRPBCC domain-containing protein [Bacteroidota bacterium]